MYVSIEEANAYFANRLYADAWDSASEQNKEKALHTATKRIDSLQFIGTPVNSNQENAFPRLIRGSFGVTVDVGIPKAIKNAVCEEALYLLEETAQDRQRSKLQETGVASVTAGDASETYFENAVKRQYGLISYSAFYMLTPFLKRGVWIV